MVTSNSRLSARAILDGGNRIRVYDMESGSERVLDGAVPCSEIVLAR